MMIAIDPGSDSSAWVQWDGSKLVQFQKATNEEVMDQIRIQKNFCEICVIEQIKSYGMSVGESIFETCVWTGRFMEAFGADRVHRIPRIEVKTHLCHSAKAKDANVRQSLIDRFGVPGTKANPGMLYGVSKDIWSALAVAVTWSDKQRWDARLR